jgi:predicted small integral membrane protein
MNMRTALQALPLALVLAPSLALASTTTNVISQIAGLFYIVVGLTVVVATLLMLGGIGMWIVRLGTDETYRNEAIKMMEWAVATLFTLILILGVVEFVQTHTSITLYILSIAIIILLIWVIVTSGLFSGGDGEKEEE